MPSRTRVIAVASFALFLQGCVSGQPPAASAPASYFWLPLIGVSDAGTTRTRDTIDAMLRERGNVQGQALALTLSTASNPRSDGSIGLGVYAGGYAYYAPAPAPSGAVVVEAFDTRTLRPVWRATLSGAVTGNEAELRRALADELSRFPRPGAAGQGPGGEPDARGEAREASIDPVRQAIQPTDRSQADCCGWEAGAADQVSRRRRRGRARAVHLASARAVPGEF